MTAKQAERKIQQMKLDQTSQAIVINLINSVEETAFGNLVLKVLEFHLKEFPEANKDGFISKFINSIKNENSGFKQN